MQKVNGYTFYQLATFIHPFTDLKQGAKLTDILYQAFQAKYWLNYLQNDKLVPLVVSKDAINKLYQAINNLLPDDADWSKLDLEQELDIGLIQQVWGNARDFEVIFTAELNSINTYFVSQKLAYETRMLIEAAASLFPENIKKEIPKEAMDDVKQAGRCIAFDIPTAAAFHIIRATETVILQYYNKLGGKTIKPKMRNWGAYINALKICKADQRITGFLDHIREQYRNPVLHPETMVESEQVQVFLGVCVSAIIQMIQAIKALPPPTP